MTGKTKQRKEVVGRARQGRHRQGKQSKGGLGKIRNATEGKARPCDLVCLSLGSKRYRATVFGEDVKGTGARNNPARYS